MSRPPGRSPWIAAALCGLLALAAVQAGCGDETPSGTPSLPVAESTYLNTRAGATYVGRRVCEECHADMHESYLHTSHSRAFARVDPRHEPKGGTFRHRPSGLTYRVRNTGSALTIRESLGFPDGSEAVLAQHDMVYVAGSGTNTRSYVLPLDGFMVEAPVTWYAKRKTWDLSPGYDTPVHDSFSRPIEQACVFCHVGRTEALGGSTARLKILEDAIGCERCHGPGSLHVEKWRGKKGTGELDPTIVNPVDLPPAAQTDLCGQCHLDHTLSVPVRGRSMEDWRPGLPMEAFRTTYRVEKATSRMSVVGHVDQMRKSRCFEASGTMSCLTCHDPHDVPTEADAGAYFRRKCLTCHDTNACGIGHGDPRRVQAADDCIGCHMPSGDTDIPHFSFTHHRIGIHEEGEESYPPPTVVQTLEPSASVAHLSQADQDRNLGLAYLLLAMRRPEDPHATSVSQPVIDAYWRRAREALERAQLGGANDGIVESSLAYLFHVMGEDPQAVIAASRAALARGGSLPQEARARALDVLAAALLQTGDKAAARPVLEQLTRLRRHAADWGRLAALRSEAGDGAGALEAAERAAEIRPNKPEIQAFLAQAYRMRGQTDKARAHERIADRLRELTR